MTKGMNFSEALEEMKQGKKVARPEFVKGYWFDKLALEDIHFAMSYLDWDDLVAEDWSTIDE